MSDKVITLTKCPSKVNNIYSININNKIKPSIRKKDKNFYKYVKQIEEEIDNNV